MIKCYNCKYLIDYQKIADGEAFPCTMYENGVPDEIVERLDEKNLKCKAYPEGIPKDTFYCQNSDENIWDQECSNGYSYSSGRYDEENDQYWEERMQGLHETIHDYYRIKSWGRPMFKWEHCGKGFHAISGFDGIRHNVKHRLVIYRCYHRGHVYYFSIDLPEPVITDDMIKNGEWEVYTWED